MLAFHSLLLYGITHNTIILFAVSRGLRVKLTQTQTAAHMLIITQLQNLDRWSTPRMTGQHSGVWEKLP